MGARDSNVFPKFRQNWDLQLSSFVFAEKKQNENFPNCQN